MLDKLIREPLMFIVGGGTILIQAIMQTLMAFGVHITPEQQTAVMTLAGIVLPLIARNFTTAMSSLPAGVAAQMASQKMLDKANGV